MLFSIITATYNSEKTISKSIKSVLDQTFEDFEILIIDNISNDKTLKICKNFNDKRVKIFSNKDNGIYHAMNIGAKKSLGRYISFLNSDDFFFSKTYLMSIFMELKKKSFDIIYSKVLYKKTNLILRRQYNVDNFFVPNFLKKILIPHPGTFFNKSFFFNIGGFSENYKISGDFDFFLRSSLNKNTKYCSLNEFGTIMSTGGASSGLINIIKSNKECYLSLKKNKIRYPILMILIKILSKIFQYRVEN